MPSLMFGRVGAALRHRDLDQLADAGGVDRRERVLLDDLQLRILRQERARVVARHAEAGLRQVVGAEAEELGRLRDLVGGERAARDLDHRADHVVQLDLLLGLDLAGGLVHDLDLQIQLLLEADQRDHDLGPDLDAFLLDLAAASNTARACIAEISG